MKTLLTRRNHPATQLRTFKFKKVVNLMPKYSVYKLREVQKSELKEALREAVLIGRGAAGTPLSELWDE